MAGRDLSGCGAGIGALAQPASNTSAARAHAPTIDETTGPAIRFDDLMWLILLEALGALALLIFIVWWTMFSGRDKGERRDRDR
jgi:hypothetical protein